ncbi:MAG: efflux RND transporter permease subunit, partial [Spirochaetes bacterium]|nr:efflux RND transporter permease subunit [Spirochaetota bacterium]
IIIIGIASMLQLKQDIYPDASPDIMFVNITYPGAAATDVELNAIVPIERKIKKINGIKEYFSLSVENSGRVVVYIDPDVDDVKAVKDEIFRELANVPDIADEVEDIEIIEANPKLRAVYEIGISEKDGYNITEKELYDFVDDLEKKVLKVKGVSDVRKEGYSDREIKINVDPKKMSKYYISLNDIVSSIKTRNVRITGGTLQSVFKDKTIVTIGEFIDPMEVKEVIIRSNFEQSRVRIKDIATVEDGFKKNNVEVKINGEKGVSLEILKKANADVVKTVKSIKKFLKSVENNLPEGIEIAKIKDESLSITSLLNVVRSNALIGFIFVFIVLFIFLLDFRTSFWTAFGIPITVLLTLTFMYFFGFSINIVTLGALVTVMGMLVDHGIVISENIYEHKLKGLSPIEATITGIKEVIAPVTVTIVTTIVAFIPMFYIKGMMGKFIYVFPVVVIFALLASFFEACFILPNHLSHGKIKTKNKNWFEPIVAAYEKFLHIVLKYRYIVVLFFVGLFVLTIFIAKEPIKNFILFDDDSSDQIFIKLEAVKGTNLSTTSNYTKKIEEIIPKIVFPNELISIKTITGHHIVEWLNHKGRHENWALIGINLVPLTQRKRNADEIMNALREKINIKDLDEFEKIVFEKVILGPPTGDPVDIKIICNDMTLAMKIKNGIQDYLAQIDGVIDIDDDQKTGKDEIKIDFDYNKMAKLGLNVSTVAQTVRTAYEGVIATSIQATDNELDFRVKIDDSYQRDEKFLMNLLIPNKYGRLIKLKDIAKFSLQKSKSIINHYDGDKVITITANIKEKKTTSQKVMKMVEQKFGNIKTEYPDVNIKFGGEAEETKETLRGLVVAFAIAIILIYFVLILLFKSFGQPILVMITIPFGIIGAMFGFITHGLPL